MYWDPCGSLRTEVLYSLWHIGGHLRISIIGFTGTKKVSFRPKSNYVENCVVVQDRSRLVRRKIGPIVNVCTSQWTMSSTSRKCSKIFDILVTSWFPRPLVQVIELCLMAVLVISGTTTRCSPLPTTDHILMQVSHIQTVAVHILEKRKGGQMQTNIYIMHGEE